MNGEIQWVAIDICWIDRHTENQVAQFAYRFNVQRDSSARTVLQITVKNHLSRRLLWRMNSPIIYCKFFVRRFTLNSHQPCVVIRRVRWSSTANNTFFPDCFFIVSKYDVINHAQAAAAACGLIIFKKSAACSGAVWRDPVYILAISANISGFRRLELQRSHIAPEPWAFDVPTRSHFGQLSTTRNTVKQTNRVLNGKYCSDERSCRFPANHKRCAVYLYRLCTIGIQALIYRHFIVNICLVQ